MSVTSVQVGVLDDHSLEPLLPSQLQSYVTPTEWTNLSNQLHQHMCSKITPERMEQHRKEAYMAERGWPMIFAAWFLCFILVLVLLPSKANDGGRHIVTIVAMGALGIWAIILRYGWPRAQRQVMHHRLEQEALAVPILQQLNRRKVGKPGDLIFLFRSGKGVPVDGVQTSASLEILIKQANSNYQELV